MWSYSRVNLLLRFLQTDVLGLLFVVILATPLMSLPMLSPFSWSLSIPSLLIFNSHLGITVFSNFLRKEYMACGLCWLFSVCFSSLVLLPFLLVLCSWRLTSMDSITWGTYLPVGAGQCEAVGDQRAGGETWRITEDYQRFRFRQVVMTITAADLDVLYFLKNQHGPWHLVLSSWEYNRWRMNRKPLRWH